MNDLNIITTFAQLLNQLLKGFLAAQQEETLSASLPPLQELFTLNELHEYPRPSTLQHLTKRLKISPFEQWVILFCAALELEPATSACCAQLQGNNLNQPTPDLALKLLPDPTWQAFNSSSPLFHWQLLNIQTAEPFSLSLLSIDRPLFFWLIGETHHDPELDGFTQPLKLHTSVPLTPSQAILAHTLSQHWTQPQFSNIQQLIGNDPQAHRAIAHTATEQQGYTIYIAQLSSFSSNTTLINDPRLLRNLARRWERAARLTGSVLLLECQDADFTKPETQTTLNTLLSEWQSPVILSVEEKLQLSTSTSQDYDVPPATSQERELIWQHCLGEQGNSLNGTLPQIADQFPLTPQQIATLAQQLPTDSSPTDLSKSLWQACRQSARPHLEDLAQRIETKLSWDDLVLPKKLAQRLQSIVAAARQRNQVYQDWGFAQKQDRGLALAALFAGDSGTGKTTAAEIIAKELALDCYRIDLSNIVNKYIGETEKNLKRVFDAAEGSGAMLLFDEADAVFGMRGEVKEAKDRYANQEVSYLLQRLETFPGIAILTTNLKKSIDEAFLRRLRYVIDFPVPVEGDRLLMWQRVFPEQAPLEDVSYKKLAKLNVTGGNIRNIALTAAFLAADAGGAITMEILSEAVDIEYDKLGRQISGPEFTALGGEISYPPL
ncbi:MAG: ATP-binding protein [Cyanophyceae cyanobacterium]